MDWEKARAIACYLYASNGMTLNIVHDQRALYDNYTIYVYWLNHGEVRSLSAGGIGYTEDETWLEAFTRIVKWLGTTENELKIIADLIG